MAVVKPGRGQGAYLGAGEETTRGTEAARSNWLRVNAVSLRRVRETEVLPDLGRLGQASSNPREWFIAEDRVEGSCDFNVSYDDSTLLILKHLLGAVATSGAGPFTHTFTLATPQPEGLTLEAGPGTFDFNAAQQFTGCLISRGTITVVPKRPIVCSFDVMGKTSGGLEAVATPTYSSNGERVYQQHAAAATLGSDEVAFKQMVIRVDRGLEPLNEVGSLNPSRPVEGRLSVEVELLLAWQLAKFHTNYFADTQESWSVNFTSGSKQFNVVGQNSKVMDTSEPVSGPGMVEQRVTLKCFAGAANQGLQIVVVNGNSSATAN